MGADAAVQRHDGTPPGEDQIAARMRAEGLSPHGWGNGPGDTYGWHEHGYEKVLYCLRGRIVFHTAGGDIELGPGDKMVLPPHTAHAATVGAEGVRCIEAPRQRDQSQTRARLTGSATRRTCPMTCRGPDVPHRGRSGRLHPKRRCIKIRAGRSRWTITRDGKPRPTTRICRQITARRPALLLAWRGDRERREPVPARPFRAYCVSSFSDR